MSQILNRLRRGERSWAAELVLRSLGLLLLAALYSLGTIAHRWTTTWPVHQATAAEFGLCLVMALLLGSGLALSMFGPRLFEHVPIPRGNILYWSAR